MVEPQPDGVEVPGVPDTGLRLRRLDLRQRCKAARIARRDGFAARTHGLQPLQLDPSQRRCDVCKVVLVSGVHDFVCPAPLRRVALPRVVADAVQRHHAYAVGERRVVRYEHPSFGRRHGLRRVEAERGRTAERPDPATAQRRRERVRGVVHHAEFVLGRECQQPGQVAWLATVMDGDEGPQSPSRLPVPPSSAPTDVFPCDHRAHAVRSEVQRRTVHVHQARARA